MKIEELRELIRETVRESLVVENDGKVHMGKAYRMKEDLMKVVQDGIRAYADEIESQEQFEGIVDQEIQKLREDLDLTMSMIGRALYQVPFQAFKVPESK